MRILRQGFLTVRITASMATVLVISVVAIAIIRADLGQAVDDARAMKPMRWRAQSPWNKAGLCGRNNQSLLHLLPCRRMTGNVRHTSGSGTDKPD
ncbi:hypothetical protein P7L70_22625 [Tistrella mobilis]|uniref:hypothetical protein n=1 Tax=Tistrella mobilis TaxID=171437 RepID=UPI0035591B89